MNSNNGIIDCFPDETALFVQGTCFTNGKHVLSTENDQ